MKRLTVFGAIFGCGLLLLALLLGPARLVQDRPDEREIATSDLSDLPVTMGIKDPGQGGRAIGVAAEGAGKLPHWIPRPGGAGKQDRVKAWELTYRKNEPFATGVHLTEPRLELFPARQLDERATTVIEAGGADLAFRGDVNSALQFADDRGGSETAAAVKAFTLAPAVKMSTFDATGAPQLTLTTARLEAPEAPLATAGPTEIAARLVAPGELHATQADGSLDLRAGGMELLRNAGHLELRPPLRLVTNGLSLPGFGAEPSREPQKPRAPLEPITITATGPTTFDRAAGEPADQLFGPGELRFTGHVEVRQGDRSLTTERLRLQIARGADDRLFIEEMEAGVPTTPLSIGLLSGRGSASAAHWRLEPGDLVLDGPVEFADFVLGEGEDARRVSLSARRRAVVRKLAAEGPRPERMVLTLEEAAHLEVAGELIADAATLEVELLPPARDANGVEQPARLIEARLLAAPTGALAHAELPDLGGATARSIRLTDDGSGGRLVHLEGNAHAEFPQGFVAAPELDLHVPADRKQAATLTVPQLTAAAFDLPAGTTPFEPTASAQRLVIEPLAACGLTRVGARTDFTGRARYLVHAAGAAEGAAPLQELTADELHLIPADERIDAVASGTVVLTDAARGLTLLAARLRTVERAIERDGRAATRRLLIVEGAPASAMMPLRAGDAAPLTIRAPRLELDLERRALDAFGDADRARLLVPEEVAGALFAAAAEPGVAPGAPIELECGTLRFAPDGNGNLDRGTLVLEGGLVGKRPRDLALLVATTARFDLASGDARIDGSAGAPATLTRPKPYDAQRVESLETLWLQVERGGQRIRCADDAVLVFHPEEPPTAAKPVPQFRRVTMTTHDGPDLIGEQLTMTGGVEFDFEFDVVDDQGALRRRVAHATGSRAIVDFDRITTGASAGPLAFALVPRLLTLTQHVEFGFEKFHLAGATLAYRLLGTDEERPKVGWFVLKKGVERVSFGGAPETGDWQIDSNTEFVQVRAPTANDPDFVIEFGPASAVIEALTGG